ncbi:urease accessory protein [Cesiribacter sp. SM1]|uniref:urease accessory protein n=1 Tax=Cesiribacter sp. SM1 TaxID=2861196 RepID=UPI001CD2421C|nr:urease accessory protein [Cesiribacter sp. SM1]
MEEVLPILFAAVVGMGHAFEADHLIAMSAIVNKRDSMLLAARDGLYWGLGHTTTIVVVGAVIMLSKTLVFNSGYFEAAIGVMLILVGILRLSSNKKQRYSPGRSKYSYAYMIGLAHGLAGSGALVLLVMSEIADVYLGILYLLIFGIGSIAGMLIAASLFSIPFTPRMKINQKIRELAVGLSSLLCIIYGGWMIYVNIG